MITMKIHPAGQLKRYELKDGEQVCGNCIFDEDSATIIEIATESDIFYSGLFRAAAVHLLEMGNETVLLNKEIEEKAKKLGIIKRSAGEEIKEEDILSCCHGA